MGTLNAMHIGCFCKQEHTYPSCHLCAHLEGAPKGEREGPLQVPLLGAPALAHLVVTHHHLLAALVETWVDVKGNVVASQKVHGEPGKEIKVVGKQAFVCVCKPLRTVICMPLCVLCRSERRTEIWLSQNLSLHFSIWLHVAKDGHHHLVIHSSGQIQVVWHTLNARQWD